MNNKLIILYSSDSYSGKVYYGATSDPSTGWNWDDLPVTRYTDRTIDAFVEGDEIYTVLKEHPGPDIQRGVFTMSGLDVFSQQYYATATSIYDTDNKPSVVALPKKSLEASVSASSTFGGYSANNTNDGDSETTVGPSYSWTNSSSLPETLTFDLGSNKDVTRVDLYTSAGYPIKDYEVRYHNGSTYQTVKTISGNTDVYRKHHFEPVNTRYIQIYCISGPSVQPQYARINEIEIY